MPMISIIVPVYKGEDFIHRCVDSILNQTFTDFELILVDDGSPDNCGAICDEYVKKDSRVRVIHKSNGGLSSARNAGIDAAQGKYIMFCDSDDYVSVDFCAVMYNAAIQNEHSFIASNLWKVKGNEVKSYQPMTEELKHLSYFQIYKYGISAYACNKIYETALINGHNLRFDESCRFAEDVGFNTQYCSLCSGCVYVPKALYYYVSNPDSIMNRYYPDYFSLHLPLFSHRLPLISEADIPEYCDIWLYQFLGLFSNVFDSRNTMSFWNKMRYNQKMLQSEEFRFCLKHATGKKENPLAMKVLQTHNYYLFWLFNQFVQLKGKFRRYKK